MSFGYDKLRVELRFNKALKQVRCDGKELPFAVQDGAVVMDLPGDQSVEFSF